MYITFIDRDTVQHGTIYRSAVDASPRCELIDRLDGDVTDAASTCTASNVTYRLFQRWLLSI